MVGFRRLSRRAFLGMADLSHHLGGTVLFGHRRPYWLRYPQRPVAGSDVDLTAQLQALAATPPLFVAVDQEGGNVARLGPAHGFPSTLPQGELDRRDDLDLTRENARTIAGSSAQTGVNLTACRGSSDTAARSGVRL